MISESGLHSKVFKSITSDDGSEFADLSHLEPLKAVYFTHPYASGERRANERHNGLIRCFIAKGRRTSDYSDEFITKIKIWCNSLQWKMHGYLTSDEAFEDLQMDCIY